MAGDEKSVLRIIGEYEARIGYFFRSKVGDRDDAEDLVQEVLFRIVGSIATFVGRSALSTWIYGVCRNVLYHYYWQKKRSEKIFRRLTDRFAVDEFDGRDLRSLIENLKKPLSTVYDLYYRKNYKIKEMAKLLDRPEGTIKYLLYTLRLEIRRYYGDADRH
jgi:RNA polymerase sigma-70 factor (ECF subfamily)